MKYYFIKSLNSRVYIKKYYDSMEKIGILSEFYYYEKLKHLNTIDIYINII